MMMPQALTSHLENSFNLVSLIYRTFSIAFVIFLRQNHRNLFKNGTDGRLLNGEVGKWVIQFIVSL